MENDLQILDAAAPAAEPAASAPEPSAESGGNAAAAAPEAPAAESATRASSAPPEPPVEIEYPDEPEGVEDEAANPAPTEAAPAADPELSPVAAKFGVPALNRALKDSPALQQAVEANPRVKSELYRMARRSQELGELQEIVPTPARAREAVEAQTALQNIEQVYQGDKPEQFWRALYEANLRPDAESGQMRSTGAYERNVQFLHKTFLDRMEQSALRSNNETVSTAARTLREALGWTGGPARTPAATGAPPNNAVSETNLPPHIRQRLEQADANERELEQLRTRRSEEARQTTERFLDDTAGEVATELRTFVDTLLASAKLSDYDKQNIARDFIESVSTLADQDKVQAAALEEILRAGGPTPATRAKMVARAKAWARQNGREILEPILTRAGAGLKQRQAQREAAQARRPEPAASGAPAAPQTPSARDLVSQREQKLKRRLTDREILDLT